MSSLYQECVEDVHWKHVFMKYDILFASAIACFRNVHERRVSHYGVLS